MKVQITAIVAIAVLVVVCMLTGHNGAIAASGFTIIGGLAGYQAGTRRNKSWPQDKT